MYSIVLRKKEEKVVGATLFTKANAFFAQWKPIENLGVAVTVHGIFEHKLSFATKELADETWEKLKKELNKKE